MKPPALVQVPLPLRGAEEAVFSQLVGRANAPAVKTLRSIAVGQIADWGYAAGPAGAGKTHALLAATRAAHEAGRRAGYVAAANLGGDGAGLESQDGFEFLALDDVDRLIGAPVPEEALFHGLNRWRAGGCQVLVSGRTPARQLAPGLPDLASRLAAMTEIRLRLLEDDDERAELLRRRGRARGIALNDEVVGYLLRRQNRSPSALVGLLDRLTEASFSSQRRITVPFVKALLATGADRSR